MVDIRARELGAKVIVAVIKGDIRTGRKSQQPFDI
jgi:hypothetical protein